MHTCVGMSDYSSFSGGNYGASQEKGRVMEQVRSQIAVANLQEMIMVRRSVSVRVVWMRNHRPSVMELNVA